MSSIAAPSSAAPRSATAPIVIGHRGACGYVPEHTLPSYFIAICLGADYIEPDLVMTRDGVLVARHENEIGGTTDVAAHAEFAARRTTKSIDGHAVTGWFTEDFTLSELKTLRARERIPGVRPANAHLDQLFEVPTFEEILVLVQGMAQQRCVRAGQLGVSAPTRIGVYPETKHPSYFSSLGLAMEAPLVHRLESYGYTGPHGAAFLQSFEVGNLQALAGMTRLPLVQLIEERGAPYDFVARKDPRTYADLCTPAGLKEIARYAQAIGPCKSLVIPRTAEDALGTPTALVRDAHAAGLAVHAWTFRAENAFLPLEMRSAAPEYAAGHLAAELDAFLAAGLDGFFIDQPDEGARARDRWAALER